MSEFTPAVLAALLAFGASSALAQTSSLPPLPELKFVEIPAASRANYLGDRWSYMEAGRADASPVVLLHGVGANSMHWRVCPGPAQHESAGARTTLAPCGFLT